MHKLLINIHDTESTIGSDSANEELTPLLFCLAVLLTTIVGHASSCTLNWLICEWRKGKWENYAIRLVLRINFFWQKNVVITYYLNVSTSINYALLELSTSVTCYWNMSTFINYVPLQHEYIDWGWKGMTSLLWRWTAILHYTRGIVQVL